MKRTDRLECILTMLGGHGEVDVSNLAEELDVSKMTIRRDLEELERQGRCRRIHGGAVTSTMRRYVPPFTVRREHHHEAKERIGKKAAELISTGETVILDIGTTPVEVAKALRGRHNLTVVTANLHIALMLADETGVECISIGGVVRAGELSTVGSLAERSLEDFHVDICVTSVGGISTTGGLTEYHPEVAALTRAQISRAREIVVVADESKLGVETFATVAPVSMVDVLVTSASPSNPHLADLRKAGVDILNV